MHWNITEHLSSCKNWFFIHTPPGCSPFHLLSLLLSPFLSLTLPSALSLSTSHSPSYSPSLSTCSKSTTFSSTQPGPCALGGLPTHSSLPLVASTPTSLSGAWLPTVERLSSKVRFLRHETGTQTHRDTQLHHPQTGLLQGEPNAGHVWVFCVISNQPSALCYWVWWLIRKWCNVV